MVWQPFICHRTGLTLRGLTREVMSPNVKRWSRVHAPNSSFYVSRRDRFREFLKGVIRVPQLTAKWSSDGRRVNLSSLTCVQWSCLLTCFQRSCRETCSHAKLYEESELSICEPSIVIKLAFERVSLYREGDIRPKDDLS